MKKLLGKIFGRKVGLKEKILLPVAALFVLGVVAILLLVVTYSATNQEKLTNDLMNEMNNRYANGVQAQLNSALNGTRSLKPIFESTRVNSRSADIALLNSILEQNDGVFGVYTLWEPNKYDGMDVVNAGKPGHDETGRFIPYIHRSDSGIQVEALTGYTEEGAGDYYLLPKNTLKECILDPFTYQVNGKDEYMASMVVPLVKNDEFVGIVGMDVLVDTLITDIKGVTLFKTGYMFMTDSQGIMFYHPDSTLVGKSLLDMVNEDQVDNVKAALKSGEHISFEKVSPVSGKVNKYELTPVSVGENHWMVVSSVPVSELNEATNQTILIGGITGVGAILVTLVLLLLIVTKITKPVGPLERAAYAIETGNIDSSVSESLRSIKSKDEIGRLANSMLKAVGSIERVAADTRRLSDAVQRYDLSVDIDTAAHSGIYQDIMDIVKQMFTQLSQIVSSISVAVEQVSSGASQVASGAQALAAGSSEQASSVEELSATVTKIADQAVDNSNHVQAATEYVSQVVQGVDAGNEHMLEMTKAMADISSASNEIANITKMIEDIAFQTNILALNAAIEAARAGNAGKGFAVVADEVRNLAAKSAEAAKQTASLIRVSADSVSEGKQISEKTARILEDVGGKALGVNDSIQHIQYASTEQVAAIEQVKQGLLQISAVVQTNAATAEENSATSEEMSAQAAMLQAEVGKYNLKTGHQHQIAVTTFNTPGNNGKDTYTHSDLGKY